MSTFKCIECGKKEYAVADVPASGICDDPNCPGEGLTGLIVPI